MTFKTMITSSMFTFFMASAAQASSLNVICHKAEALVDGAQFTSEAVPGWIENSCQSLSDEVSQTVSFRLATDEIEGVEQPFAKIDLEVEPESQRILSAEVHHSTGKDFKLMTPKTQKSLLQVAKGDYDLKQEWNWTSPKSNVFILGKTLRLACEIRFVDSCE